MEEENKKPNKRSKKIIITKLNKNGELDSREMTPEEMENIGPSLMEALEEIKKDMEKSNNKNFTDNKNSYLKEKYVEERVKQDLELQKHDTDRKKLFTLFEIITNTKELLIQRIGDSGKSDLQHSVIDTTKTAANNVISICLKQIYLWVEKNDINELKQIKENNKKSTNPDDILNKDLFK